ncbi:PREDICTED: UDP-GlcNAc:betaGal beta-1,3-N-acetylglucosaminyltransferase 7-like [Priapulus caudatus]|uniref:Hexosyltransferase n=1 Tax=Priapulus caudatus TaxID=37621 RepID=A0ABM1F0H7_PRICU|nr:PREDICTED: UDP-GlcNAc:betaGal beta-1,3-N-acetylglucosaminyltransferase 7-like [Priapulus caudatus]
MDLCRHTIGHTYTEPAPARHPTSSKIVDDVIPILTSADVCAKNSLPIVIGVLLAATAAGATRQRAIRETWGGGENAAVADSNVTIVFVLGTCDRDVTRQQLAIEARAHGDVIQGAFADTYRNLTMKTLFLLQWTSSQYPDATYLLKTDDDVFINVDSLLKLTRSTARTGALIGCINRRSKVVRSLGSKWQVSRSLYSAPYYPAYVGGAGFLMSADVVKALHAAAMRTAMIPVEDAFITGVVAARVGVVPCNSDRFGWYGAVRRTPCEAQYAITTHLLMGATMLELWNMTKRAKTTKC